MKNFIIAGAFLAAVAVFLTVVGLTSDAAGPSSQGEPSGQAADDGPTTSIDSLRSTETVDESAATAEVIARVMILERSGQLYAAPPTWDSVASMDLGLPYVWFRASVREYLKGEDIGQELRLMDIGGPNVAVEGSVGSMSGLSTGDEAVVFLGCDEPKPMDVDCGVMDAYIIDGDTARSPLNEKELPVAELEPRIEAALAAAP